VFDAGFYFARRINDPVRMLQRPIPFGSGLLSVNQVWIKHLKLLMAILAT
jgi:hypothetical protein